MKFPKTLTPAKVTTYALNTLLYGVFLAAFLIHFDNEIVYWFLLVQPWFCIFLVYKFPGHFTFAGGEDITDDLENLLPSMFLSMTFMLVTLRNGVVIPEWAPLLFYAIAFNVLLVGVITKLGWKIKRNRFKLIPYLFVFMLPYSYSAISFINTLDPAPPQIYQTILIDKYVSSGKYGAPYFIVLGWKLEPVASKILVTADLYDKMQPRAKICMYVKKGLLGITWYEPEECVLTGEPSHPDSTRI